MRRSSGSRKGAAIPGPSSQSVAPGSKLVAKDQEKIDSLFTKYADKLEEGCIGPEGVEQLCNDLGVEPTDVRILLFAWKLQASRMGYFSQEEWRRGLRLLRADSVEKVKKALPALQLEISSPSAFQDFYRFAFQYCLTEPRQKTLDLETASTMLQLVASHRPHVDNFLEFLQEQTEYKAINLDQWMAFLRFSEEINSDFSNYDENMAWPLLMDNFAEWGEQRFR